MYQQDSPVKVSNKQFRLPIDGFLRSLGLYQIIGTKHYLEIEFVGGESSVRILYPNDLEELHEAIRKELLAETELGSKEIDDSRFYINGYMEEIEEARNSLVQ